MPIVTFAPAQRLGTHVIITLYGESGCGKTMSAIKLGRGLVGPKGRLGLLDTESGRGRIYAKLAGGYEYAALTPPFTPERYIEAIDAAEEAGIEALIIDSGSMEWDGLGGILETAEAGRSQGGQPLQGLVKWAKPKAQHKRYVQRLLQSRMHLLISLRAKERMVQLTAKDKLPAGMKVGDIISAGYVPIQDKRFIYETTVQLFLPANSGTGIPLVEKCPEDLRGAFQEGKPIDESMGRFIAEWIAGGTPVDREFEMLKLAAEEAAGKGTDALRAHWRGLSKAHRDRLAGEVDNLGSIAATADAEAEARRVEQAEAHGSFQTIDEIDEQASAGALRHPTPPETEERAGDPDPSTPAAPPVSSDRTRACEVHRVIDCARCRPRDPERAEAADPESKPPEAAMRAVDGAGSSSEADARQSAPAAARPDGPVRQETRANPVNAGGAGGSPAPERKLYPGTALNATPTVHPTTFLGGETDWPATQADLSVALSEITTLREVENFLARHGTLVHEMHIGDQAAWERWQRHVAEHTLALRNAERIILYADLADSLREGDGE